MLIRMGRGSEVPGLFPAVPEAMFFSFLRQGDFAAVAARLPAFPSYSISASWLAGKGAEILTEFPLRHRLHAEVLLSLERYEDVLARCPDEREACATALLALGRGSEVAARYPECRQHCAQALLMQGRLDEALKAYPDCRPLAARSLLDIEDFAAVAARFADQPTEHAIALIRLGRTTEAFADTGLLRPMTRNRCDLVHLAALEAAARGDRRRAMDINRTPHVHQFSDNFDPCRFGHFLLQPVLRALEGDSARLHRACRALMDSLQYQMMQQLWYETGYLSGVLSEEQFRAQPLQFGLEDRLTFYRALRADLAGDTTAAARDYRQCLDRWLRIRDLPAPYGYTHLLQSATVRRFAQWRAEVLTARP
jgi:hypothetical protein